MLDFSRYIGIDYSGAATPTASLKGYIPHLLKRPVGRPPKDVRRYHASVSYRAASWTRPRRVVARVEWYPGELYPKVGFVVTNLSRPAERVVAFYNQRGTAEQYIKEGKNAIRWTRLSCRKFRHNAVRLQLHALEDIRGRVIGLYNMSAHGLRTFSGVTVGFGGSLIGVHWSLALSAMALLALTVGLLSFTSWARPGRDTA